MRTALLLIIAALALVAPAAHAEPSGPPAASEEIGTEKVVISAGTPSTWRRTGSPPMARR